MSSKYAVRNVRLCTKDCLCLYVCPTGASDTENSVIDVSRCIGCGDCADVCPSGAISMVPFVYPEQQPKAAAVVTAMNALLKSKAEQEHIASALPGRLAGALARSNRIMGEDIIREGGFLLPQSGNSKAFLRSLLAEAQPEGFPDEIVRQLLQLID